MRPVMDAVYSKEARKEDKLLISFKNLLVRQPDAGLFRKFSTLAALGLATLGSLTGCEAWQQTSIASICESHPTMCNDLNPDAWCRAEKAEIIRHRYLQLTEPQQMASGQQQYALFKKWESYQACIVKASGIQHIKQRDKEAGRMRGVLTAQRELKKLKWQTQDSADPYLAFYHWSRFHQAQAGERFMQAARRGELQHDPQLLVMLASMQVKSDPQTARATLFDALALYQDPDHIDPEIFGSLSTMALYREQLDAAYVWLQVARAFDLPEDATVTRRLASLDASRTEQLDEVADKVIDALEDSAFNAYNLGLHRL